MELRSSLVVLLLYVVHVRAQYSFDVLDGSSVTLQCKTNEDKRNVPTTYVWTDPENNVKSRDINLLIPNFSSQHEGTYTCTAIETVNGVGHVVKKMIFVRMKGKNEASKQSVRVSVPSTYETFASGIIYLLCKSSDGNDMDYEFRWTSPTGQTVQTSSFYKNLVNFDDSGHYICKMKRKSDGIVSEGYTVVTVNSLPMKIEKVSGILRMGETVKLKCEIDKSETNMKVYENFLYTWIDPTNRVISYDKVVDIKLEGPSKYGKYQCKATSINMKPSYFQVQEIELRYTKDVKSGIFVRNREGESERRVAITYVGRFVSNPHAIRYFNPLQLVCSVTPALLDVTYKIFFNNQFLTNSNSHTIPHLGKEHLGIYQCHINGRDVNSKDQISLKTTFTIESEYNTLYKIEMIQSPGPQLFIRPGDKRELYCKVPSNSGLHGRDAVWYFNGKHITPADFRQYNINILPTTTGNAMVLNQIQSANEGKYECKFRDETKEAYILVISDVKGGEFQASVSLVYDTFITGMIQLLCKSSTGTDSEYEFEWITPSGTTHRNSVYHKSQATTSDAGLYRCRIKRISDGIVSEGYTMVTVNSLPIKVVQQSGTVKLGETVRLLCEIDKSKTDQKVHTNFLYQWTDPYKTVISNQPLVDIRLHGPSSLGNYQCKITSTNTYPQYSQVKEIELKMMSDLKSGSQDIRERLVTKYVGTLESDKKVPRYFEPLKLSCNVNPPLFDVTFTISFNDQILTTLNSYTIPRLGKEHLGVYQCNIKGVNVLTREVIQLHSTFILQPDFKRDSKIELIHSPGQQIFVRTGDRKDLYCDTSSSPGVHGKDAIWYFNGRNLGQSDFNRYNVNILPSTQGSTMVLSNLQSINEGKYECNVKGVTKEVYILIMPGNTGKSYSVSVPPTYETFASGMIYLLCKSSDGNDEDYEFQWITPTGITQKASSFYKNQVGYHDSGRYTCKMKRKSDNVVLEGSTMVSINPLPMKIEKVSGNLLLGETVKLKCDVDKSKTNGKVHSDYLYTWTDPQHKVISNDQTVDIRLESQTSFGKYQCKAIPTNMYPIFSQVREIELKYIPGPETAERTIGDHGVKTYTSHFISNPQNLRFYSPVELICSVNPFLSGASYQIFFNKQLLTTSHTYKISQLTKDDLGVYQCHITGKDSTSGLNIRLLTEFKILSDYSKAYRIVLVQSPGPQMFVKTGDKRELFCEVPSNQGLHGRDAIWYFNGRDISPNDIQRYNIQILPTSEGSTILLKDIQSSNEGKYECRVKGEMKEAYVLVMSGGKGKPFQVSVPTKYDTFPSGMILLVCKSSEGTDGDYEYQWITSTGSIQPGSAFYSNQVGIEDSGRYTCRIKRKSDGVVSEGHTMVTINPLPIHIEKVSGSLQLGETVKLKCEVDRLKTDNKVSGNYRYSWIDPTNKVISQDQHVDIKLGDPFSFGRYQCKVESVNMNPPYSQIQEIELRYSQDSKFGGRNSAEQIGTTYVGHFKSSKDTFRFSDSLDLTCSVSPPLNNASYEILFNNQLLTRKSHYNIRRLEKENLGVYQCNVIGRDSNSGNIVHLKITYIIQQDQGSVSKIDQERRPPRVSVPSTYGTFTSGMIYLFCKSAEGNDEDYEFQWETPSKNIQKASSFYKNQINFQDSGRYTCRMTRKSDGIVSEGHTMVTVNPIPIKIEKVSGALRIGETLKLKCEIDKLQTDQKVSTNYVYSWIDPSNRVISQDQLVEIKLGDASSFGKYQCKVTSVNVSPQYSQTQDIEIKFIQESRTGENLKSEDTKYTVRFDNNPKTIRYFESLVLTCNVNPSLMDVSYQIFFNNQLLTTENSYTIPRLDTERLGVYRCYVNGKDYKSGQTVNLKTTFTIQPDYIRSSRIALSHSPGPQLFVRTGDKKELHCEIPSNSGLHGRDAIWYFNGREISPNDVMRYNIYILQRMSVSIMVLKNIQYPNEGKYECRVKGDSKEAYILVMATPSNPQESMEIVPGSTAHLRCQTKSNEQQFPTTYQWLDPNNNVKGSNVDLFIPNFSNENQGRYTCTTTQKIYGVDTKSVKSIYVKIKGSPELENRISSVSVPQRYDTVVGGVLYLLCKTSEGNDDNYEFTWITPSGNIHSTFRLFKDQVGYEDSGRYVCRMKRKYDGVITEGYTIVTINPLPIKIEKVSGTLRMGENIRLKCEIDKTQITNQMFTNFIYSWLDPRNTVISTDPVVDIRLEGPSAFGKYQCKATSLNMDPPYSQIQEIELRVTQEPNSGENMKNKGRSMEERVLTTYTGSLDSNRETFKYSDSLELTCSASPPLADVSYEIYFNNQFLTRTNSYRISSIGKEHLGVYQCNINGRDPSSGGMVHLKATYTIRPDYGKAAKIELIHPPGPQVSVRPGEKKELYCEVPSSSGLNGRDVRWFFNSNEIRTNDHPIYKIMVLETPTGSTVLLQDIQLINKGKYECRIRGEVKEVYILVLPDTTPKSFQVSVPTTYDALPGGTIHLQCKSTDGNDADYDYQWSSPNGNVQTTSSFYKGQVGFSDAGRYVCRMKRRSDGVTSEGHTIVTISPLPMKIEKISGTLLMGETVRLRCTIDFSKTNNNLFSNYMYSWTDPMNRIISNDQIVDIRIQGPSSLGKYQCKATSVNVYPPYFQIQEIELRISPDSSTGQMRNKEQENKERVLTTYIGSLDSNRETFKYSDSLELTCSASPPLADVSYEIYFNNQFLTRTNSYRISSIGKEHLGVYQCNINGRDPSSGGMVHLKATYTIRPDYGKPARIELIHPPGPQVSVRPGEKKELYCEVPSSSGLNGRDVRWFFNSNEIRTNDHPIYKIMVLETPTGSTVLLQDIQLINRGKYECRIRGEVKEVYILVLPDAVGNINQVSVPTTYEAFPGGMILLQCRGTNANDADYEYQWSSPDGNIHTTSSFYKNQVGFHDAGRYVCRMKRRSDGVISEGYTIVTISPLPMKIEKISGTLLMGETVRLRCAIDVSKTNNNFFSNYMYSWTDPTNRVISNDPIVEIRLVGLSSFGRYQCKATSVNVNPPYSQIQEVELKYTQDSRSSTGNNSGVKSLVPYTGHFGSSSGMIKYHNPLELVCRVNPPLSEASFQILFNNQLLTATNSYIIPRFGKDHLGVYLCIINGKDLLTGQSVHLRSTFTIQPEQRSVPTLVLKSPPGPRIMARKGDQKELHCESSEGFRIQSNEVFWYFDGMPLIQNKLARYNIYFLYRPLVSILVLRDIQSINSGRYECRFRGMSKEAYIFVV